VPRKSHEPCCRDTSTVCLPCQPRPAAAARAFSITGAVCYSRQVEQILRSLVAKGMLVAKERDTLVVRDQAAEEVRAGLRRKLPSAAYRSLQTASKRFYRVMFRKRARPQDTLVG